MTIKELIEKYRITETDHNTPEGTPALRIYNDLDAIKDGVVPEITAKKAEIIAHFAAEREARERAYAERKEKIDAIEGLNEIRKARRELYKWHEELNRQFDREEGVTLMPEYPKYNLDAMYAQYPRAAAYIKAEEYAGKENDELAAIGREALDGVIFGDYVEAMKIINEKIDQFADAHMWD